MDTFGERITAARKNKGWNQAQLAGAIGTSLKNISRWELNQAMPGLETAALIAKAMEVSLDYLGGLQSSDDELTPLCNKVAMLSKKDTETAKRVLQALISLNQ